MKLDPEQAKQFHDHLDTAIAIADCIMSHEPEEIVPGLSGTTIPIEKLVALVMERHPFPLPEEFHDRLGRMLARVISEYDISSCFVWAVAHNLGHMLEEVPDAVN